MAYNKIGSYSVVPVADVIALGSNLNLGRAGSVNAQDGAIGKVPGAQVIRGTFGTPSTYSVIMALGPLPADPWLDLSILGTVYTPV